MSRSGRVSRRDVSVGPGGAHPARVTLTAVHAEAMVVLVVEDDDDLRSMFEQRLSLDGFDVRAARGGSDAAALLDDTVDVVLCDLRLGRDSGRDVVAAVQRRSVAPVVLMSGVIDDLDVAGATFLRKPFPWRELVATLRDVVRD